MALSLAELQDAQGRAWKQLREASDIIGNHCAYPQASTRSTMEEAQQQLPALRANFAAITERIAALIDGED